MCNQGPGWLYEAALARVSARGVAVDGGAHIGTWSLPMAADFAQVLAFEPCAENRSCLADNLAGCPNVTIHAAALGAADGQAHMALCPEAGANSGQQMITAEGLPVPMRALDSLRLPALDLLKLDLEGYELPALIGARETIRRCRPVVVIEEAGWAASHGLPDLGARAFLIGLGYRLAERSNTDSILIPT
nr:FkbM family methyltransferase [Falsiroseomonas frigidaquae]